MHHHVHRKQALCKLVANGSFTPSAINPDKKRRVSTVVSQKATRDLWCGLLFSFVGVRQPSFTRTVQGWVCNYGKSDINWGTLILRILTNEYKTNEKNVVLGLTGGWEFSGWEPRFIAWSPRKRRVNVDIPSAASSMCVAGSVHDWSCGWILTATTLKSKLYFVKNKEEILFKGIGSSC